MVDKQLPLILLALTISSCAGPKDSTKTQASAANYIPKNNGIVCVAAPCFVWDIYDTSGKIIAKTSDVDPGPLKLSAAEQEKFLLALQRGEKTVRGYFKIVKNAGAAGDAKVLVITGVLK